MAWMSLLLVGDALAVTTKGGHNSNAGTGRDSDGVEELGRSHAEAEAAADSGCCSGLGVLHSFFAAVGSDGVRGDDEPARGANGGTGGGGGKPVRLSTFGCDLVRVSELPVAAASDDDDDEGGEVEGGDDESGDDVEEADAFAR